MISTKKLILTALIGSSLVMQQNNIHADLPPASKNAVIAGIGASAAVFWLYERKINNEENKSLLTKVLDLGTKSLHLPIDFCDKHKNALTVSAIAGAAVCFGPKEVIQENFKTFLGFFIMKGPAWSTIINTNKLTR